MTRNTLVVVQVALALVLVVSAALMIRTFQSLHDVDPGFSDPAAIQATRIWMPNALTPDPAQDARLQHDIVDRIAALPGIGSVGFASALPMDGQRGSTSVVIEGQTLVAGDTSPPRRMKFVSPGYFDAMGTRIIAGRDVTWSDIEAGGRVALISEDFARELGAAPAGALGARIRLPIEPDAWREIRIRSALGAEPRQLKRMFLLHGLVLSGMGAVVGLFAAMASGSLVQVVWGIRHRWRFFPRFDSRNPAYNQALSLKRALGSHVPQMTRRSLKVAVDWRVCASDPGRSFAILWTSSRTQPIDKSDGRASPTYEPAIPLSK